MNLVSQLATQQEQFKNLLTGIDRGIQDHLAWNQRLLRCALLRDPPGEDIVHLDAHQHCQTTLDLPPRPAARRWTLLGHGGASGAAMIGWLTTAGTSGHPTRPAQ